MPLTEDSFIGSKKKTKTVLESYPSGKIITKNKWSSPAFFVGRSIFRLHFNLSSQFPHAAFPSLNRRHGHVHRRDTSESRRHQEVHDGAEKKGRSNERLWDSPAQLHIKHGRCASLQPCIYIEFSEAAWAGHPPAVPLTASSGQPGVSEVLSHLLNKWIGQVDRSLDAQTQTTLFGFSNPTTPELSWGPC